MRIVSLFFLAGVAAVIALASWRRYDSRESTAPAPTRFEVPTRIVSMAPSLTETLYALGVGDRVVGVTRYCDTPPEAAQKPKVGGFLDPNYEAIVALRPDCVFLFPEHLGTDHRYERLGLRTVVVRKNTLAEILDSIRTLGAVCDRRDQAEAIVAPIEAEIERVRRAAAGLPKVRVMVCLGRRLEAGTLEKLMIVGRVGYFHEMIELAGGVNVYPSNLIQFPTVSLEGVLAMNPDVVIDLAAMGASERRSAAELAADWNAVGAIHAVRRGRIHVLCGDHFQRPGPRIGLVLREVAAAVHPELFRP